MRFKIAALLASIALGIAGLVVVTPPSAQASDANYTWVQRISGLSGKRIMIKCHTSLEWRTLNVGETSAQKCGQNGWVNAIWNPDGGYLEATNLNTGNVTGYGCNYKGSIGGGYYYIDLASFCGGGGGGGGGGGYKVSTGHDGFAAHAGGGGGGSSW